MTPRKLFIVTLALGLLVAPLPADAQQAGPSSSGLTR